MKTASFLPILLVSSSLMVSACTPKDIPVTDPNTRAKILEQNNKKNGGKNGPVIEFRIGGFSAVAVLLDRQIEALEVIRLATSKNRTEKSQYKVKQDSSEIKVGELAGYSTILTADKDTLNYSGVDQGDFKASLSKTWKVDVLFKDDKLVSISAVAEKSKTTVDKTNANKKTYLNVEDEKLVVTLKKVESQSNDHLYELVATSEGKLNGSLEGNRNKGSLQSTLKFQFGIQDLEYLQGTERSKIAASKLEGSITFTDEKGKENKNVIAAGENEVNLDGLCSYVSGKVNFKSGSLQKNMILDDEKIVVETTKYKVPLAPCGHRPAVDLSRLFVW